MSIRIEATDPRGTKVICTEEQWRWHIISARPSMKGWEDIVRSAIENPFMGIFVDATWPDRNVYYGRISGKKFYVKVVVATKDDEPAEVITAFPTDSVKPGEKLIWPKSSD